MPDLKNSRFEAMRINWDAWGITASVACAIHCAVLPLLFTSIPLMGMNILEHPVFEWAMIGLALVIGAGALLHGYFRHHHRLLPLILLLVGFLFLVGKEWMAHGHTLWVLSALAFIVTAHLLNYRFCRKANHCHANDCNH